MVVPNPQCQLVVCKTRYMVCLLAPLMNARSACPYPCYVLARRQVLQLANGVRGAAPHEGAPPKAKPQVSDLPLFLYTAAGETASFSLWRWNFPSQCPTYLPYTFPLKIKWPSMA
jgi:hypothetical protein